MLHGFGRAARSWLVGRVRTRCHHDDSKWRHELFAMKPHARPSLVRACHTARCVGPRSPYPHTGARWKSDGYCGHLSTALPYVAASELA